MWEEGKGEWNVLNIVMDEIEVRRAHEVYTTTLLQGENQGESPGNGSNSYLLTYL